MTNKQIFKRDLTVFISSFLLGMLLIGFLCIYLLEKKHPKIKYVPGQGLFYLTEKNDVVENHLRRGGWEKGVQKIMSQYLDPNKNVIDIGAYVGSHTVHLAKALKDGVVYAFEPQWNIRRKLEGNLMLNEVKNARVFAYALGSENEKSHMNLSPKTNKGATTICSSKINSTGSKCSLNTDKSRPIEIRTLDSFHFQNIGLIKIDVEGHELEVLKGAQQTLANSRPIIIIEIWNNENKQSRIDYLKDLNYSVTNIHGHDYLAIPKERLPLNQTSK